MKRLFYLSGTLFFLSLTLLVGVHIGQQTAEAQGGQKVVGFTFWDHGNNVSGYSVILTNGDVHSRRAPSGDFVAQYPPKVVGNIWQ